MKDDEYKGYYCLLIAILCETEQAAAMKALLDQGYSQDAVSEAFQCFPSTVRRRVRKLTERKETNDRSEIDCRNI